MSRCLKLASKHCAQISFSLKFVHCVKKLKIVQKRARNSKFTKIGLLGQKRGDIFIFAVYVQNGVRNKPFLEFCVLCQKQQPDKIFPKFDVKLVKKKGAQL